MEYSTKSPGMVVLENGAELLTWAHVFVFVSVSKNKTEISVIVC